MPNYLASWQPSERRDARAAEWTGLENRSRGNSTGGSNPPLSATFPTLLLVTDFIPKISRVYLMNVTHHGETCHVHTSHKRNAISDFRCRILSL